MYARSHEDTKQINNATSTVATASYIHILSKKEIVTTTTTKFGAAKHQKQQQQLWSLSYERQSKKKKVKTIYLTWEMDDTHSQFTKYYVKNKCIDATVNLLNGIWY